jgi:hypothetical protein
MAEGKVTVLALLDFLKAFDMVNHLLFLHKLGSAYDFLTLARDLVSSFLQHRSKVVEVDGVRSSSRVCIPSPSFFYV